MSGLQWHKGLSPERWEGYSIERQILMIGSEFARAKNFLRSGSDRHVAECYERAMELLDLCADDPKWRRKLKELLRFRELLGELYLDPEMAREFNEQFYRVLLSWNRETSRVEV